MNRGALNFDRGGLMYKDKAVILATKHGKEKVIQPPFVSELGCHIYVTDQYDTDQFGTFTGEIPRKLPPYETLIKKAKVAAEQFGYDCAIASEGSFGPHPYIYFAPGDTELIAFVDLKNDLIISEFEISTATNYSHKDITIEEDYQDFITQAKFPTHGLIIRTLNSKETYIEKGIQEYKQLEVAIQKAFQYTNTIRIETDMRAMMNPSRMEIIRILAIKLAKRIQQKCLQCNTPGFGKITTEGHLSCEACNAPTKFYRQKVLSCLKCDYKIYQARDDGKKFIEPQHCVYCNP